MVENPENDYPRIILTVLNSLGVTVQVRCCPMKRGETLTHTPERFLPPASTPCSEDCNPTLGAPSQISES